MQGCFNAQKSVTVIPHIQFSSFTQSCPTLHDPTDCSTPGLLVHHQLPELAQTHVHWVSDAIQPSHLCCPFLLLPSIFPIINPSNEYSGLISVRIGWFDLAVLGLSRVFSNTTVQKHQFFSAQLSLWSSSHIYTFGSEVKASASNAGDPGSIPGSRRSPGEGNGNPLQYSCLENPMDREA